MKSSIEIAQESKIKPIRNIASILGMENYIEPYGNYMAKISLNVFKKTSRKLDAKLILVTAITPTPAGEGKTVTAIGLSEALWKIGKKNIVCLRQPSLGPTFGIKGGGAGGGRSQLQPMQEVNLHFTGDFHAITAANNLLAAMVDNHIFHGNELKIDLEQVVWRRALDMDDRALRRVIIGTDANTKREESFQITSASEVMAVLCMAQNFDDLKARLARLIVAYTNDGRPVTASDMKAHGAMALLLKDTVKPNLVQTIENTPAIVHGGPFGNVAHGAPTVISIKMASKLTDYVIVEAGFGSDLGAEKFLHLVCPETGIVPSVTVMVVSIRALKMHGGMVKEDLTKENIDAVRKGIANLEKHVENIEQSGIPIVVALNRMSADTDMEVKMVEGFCRKKKISFAESNVFERGGKGGIELANAVISTMESKEQSFALLYKRNESIKEKVQKIAKSVYGAGKVVYTETAEKAIERIESLGFGGLPICFAKTQLSLSDDPKKVGRPEGFTLTVTNAAVSAGAGFIIIYAGDIMTMPGLPKSPAAEKMDIDAKGRIYGLF
ncbi:MAG TPA: formate--tetrahydrofolate ligase [Nitrososphaerales archaeon]